jgi:hypothetical protein
LETLAESLNHKLTPAQFSSALIVDIARPNNKHYRLLNRHILPPNKSNITTQTAGMSLRKGKKHYRLREHNNHILQVQTF